jgi:hypothetical protein
MDALGPALTNILSDHLSGEPIDRDFWQNLNRRDRSALSDAIVLARLKTSAEVRVVSHDDQWPHLFSRIEGELREQLGGLALAIVMIATPTLKRRPGSFAR